MIALLQKKSENRGNAETEIPVEISFGPQFSISIHLSFIDACM